jgi:hypothetical protein
MPKKKGAVAMPVAARGNLRPTTVRDIIAGPHRIDVVDEGLVLLEPLQFLPVIGGAFRDDRVVA